MRTIVPLLVTVVFASAASAEELKVYAAAAVKAPLLELAADYEAATGHKVTCVFDTAGATAKRFHADAGATLLVTTHALIAEAEKSGRLKNGMTRRLADTVGGFAVPPGSARPDISTPDTLRAALLSARRIAFSDPSRGATVGTHFMKVIESLGIKDEVLKKATLAQDGVETMRLVLENKVDLAVTQTSEVIQANPDALLGPFPAQFDLATTFSLWHPSAMSDAAKGFVSLITGPDGRAKLTKDGLRAPAEGK